MNTSNMKNIIVLKELPSNLIEEAIIFLKENQKAKKPELVDSEKNRKITNIKENSQNTKDYIIKEAQMLISEYIEKTEIKPKQDNKSVAKLKRKYKILKRICCILAIALLTMIIIHFK